MITEAYPLQWPAGFPRTKVAQRSRFRRSAYSNGSWRNSLTLYRARGRLEEEVRRIGGEQIVISTNMRTRADGGVYSNAKEPDDRGVAVYFVLKGNARCLACDQWNSVTDNTHALALTIEAMRGIERWGSSQILERIFTGFVALPEPSDAWWQVLGVDPDAGPDRIRAAYRERMKLHHPDRGGSTEEAQRISGAYKRALAEVGA